MPTQPTPLIISKYKISKSLNGNKIVWIARLKKTVIARANSEKDLEKILKKRDETIKKARDASKKKKVVKKKSLSKRLKAARAALNETEEIVEVKKPTPKKPSSKTSKKGFWK